MFRATTVPEKSTPYRALFRPRRGSCLCESRSYGRRTRALAGALRYCSRSLRECSPRKHLRRVWKHPTPTLPRWWFPQGNASEAVNAASKPPGFCAAGSESVDGARRCSARGSLLRERTNYTAEFTSGGRHLHPPTPTTRSVEAIALWDPREVDRFAHVVPGPPHSRLEDPVQGSSCLGLCVSPAFHPAKQTPRTVLVSTEQFRSRDSLKILLVFPSANSSAETRIAKPISREASTSLRRRPEK